MAGAGAGSGRCARRVLLVDLCGAGEAGASTRTVGDGCCLGRTCHRVRRNALFDGPGFSAIRGTEIGRSDALTSSKTNVESMEACPANRDCPPGVRQRFVAINGDESEIRFVLSGVLTRRGARAFQE